MEVWEVLNPATFLIRESLRKTLAGRRTFSQDCWKIYKLLRKQLDLRGMLARGILLLKGPDFVLTENRTDNDTTRRITVGGQSDLAIQVPPEIGDNTTFRLSDPPEDAAPTSPIGATAPVAGGGDTYGNISFIPEDPSGIAGLDLDTPGGNDNDDDDDDNDDQGEPEPFWDQPEAEVMEVQAAEAAERGRGRDRPMPDYDSQEEIEPGEDSDPADTTRPDISTIEEARARRARQIPKSRKRQKRISRHGTEYPPLPQPFVRRVAQRAVQTSGLSNHRISTDVLASLTQASEWFFEQLGDDLGAYADHAKRTVIEESDVITLMRR